MKIQEQAILLLLFTVIIACSKQIDLVVDHRPLLQIDAVFFSGEPLPEIIVRQSYSLDQGAIRNVDSSEFYISNAEILLYVNDDLISLREGLPGIYRPESNQIVKQGDRFEIYVQSGKRSASAVAVVPEYPVESLAISVDNEQPVSFQEVQLFPIIDDSTQTQDSLFRYLEVPVKLTLPFIPHFTAIKYYPQNFQELAETYYSPNQKFNFNSTSHPAYENILAENLQGFDKINLLKVLQIFIPSSITLLKTPYSETINYSLIIPEPIYESYHNTISDVFVPVNITNVQGGLGLFIGAIRVNGSKEISFTINTE